MATPADVLRIICVVLDRNQHLQTPKLASVEPGSIDAYYMLAAFCFDLNRKLYYTYKAARAMFPESAPFPTDAKSIAREVKRDNDTVAEAGQDWKDTAEALERVMLRLFKEINEDHERLLNRMAE